MDAQRERTTHRQVIVLAAALLSRKNSAIMSTSTSRNVHIDAEKPWRLSHELHGHSSDVKSLCVAAFRGVERAGQMEVLQSASRDESVRTWIRRTPPSEREHSHSSCWTSRDPFLGKRYQNSVAFIDDRPDVNDQRRGLTMMGGLDARILVYRFVALLNDEDKQNARDSGKEPTQILQEHYDNVCHLSVSDKRHIDPSSAPLLISSSWDCTSRVWRLVPDGKLGSRWESLHLLKGHEAAVWAAEVVSTKQDDERYLTASADQFVRLWHRQTITRVFAGHADVVRGISLLTPRETQPDDENSGNEHGVTFFDKEQLFCTCSNDGTVRVWSLDDRRCPPNNPTSGGEALRVLVPTSETDDEPLIELLYDIDTAGVTGETSERLITTCGEGGMIHFWNIDKGQRVSHIERPVTSTWSIAHLPLSGDIATGDSDGCVRIYTQRTLNSTLLAQSQENRTNENKIVEVNREELEKHEQKCKEISEARRARVQAKIVAHEGRTDALAGSGQDACMFECQRFDAVLKIDVSDDAEPLSLPLNRGDDARQKAKAFIAQHSLSERYEDDIVAFIEQVGPR